MTTDYSRSVLRLVVAQMCQTVGWHSINSTPLEFLVDLMHEYLLRISRLTHQYCEVVGRTEPNLDDLGLAFRHMNINIEELSEYVRNVDSIPCPISVPKLPIPRENHLNFLKPGSREVVTRPVHVHEHLPAMYPETEEDYPTEKSEINLTNGVSESTESNGLPAGVSDNLTAHGMSPQGVFKRPGDPVSFESPITKRPKLTEEGRPLREIHSVMMTTSGFLSPAREGKLPEARTPQQVRSDSPPPSSYPMVPPELKSDKKPKKIIKKTPEARKLDKENKKKNRAKELFKPDEVKKLTGMKELAKLKALKPGGGKTPGPSGTPSTTKTPQSKNTASPKSQKIPSKVKTEKIIEIPSNVITPLPDKKQDIDKLPSEPDKRKLNIFKKISKPEKETEKHKDLKISRENSPIDIGERNQIDSGEIKREEKKTPHTPDVVLPVGDASEFQSPATYAYTFDNMSPPGTPSTPKTPELSLPVPVEPKKKKRERVTKKKEPKVKTPKSTLNSKKAKMMVEPLEMDIMDRSKSQIPQRPDSPPHHHHHHHPPPPTPQPPPILREPHNLLPFSFFPPFPSPGLIPPPIGHPMFPRFPLPLPKGITHSHPGMANLPIPPRFLNPPMKLDDYSMVKSKPVEREKTIVPSHYAPIIPPPSVKSEKLEKEKIEKIKLPDKELILPVASPVVSSPVINTPSIIPPLALPIVPSVPIKHAKLEKLDKKSKEHKKEKKDKIKKKKDKKEKHKEKGEKIKKEKSEKKEKLEKIKEKKEKREKRKEKDLNKKTVKEEKAVIPHEIGVPKLTLKLGTSSPRPPTPDAAPMKKITIKPLLKKPEDETMKREPSPELAKISALVTRPPKQKAPKVKPAAVTKKEDTKEDKENGGNILISPPTAPADESGNQIWICPACGSQDDGSPMVGCDDCDAWYHWVCVGMHIPPASNEDWYCRQCLSKKQELHHDKKKKKGKKKKVKMPA
ncbi:transcription initiation factor TFIID subunit 3 isoform X2 [Leptopilina boulardi]|uniref:transcription initiation factor TFIID subunit 3 isoform X2 n=1 Tax=Leptopilina boulardi TaxID=63433 RepID=UPI0021F50156|nr:transcription initiation factor TFIID subunit 3 isoform X2 [Leptopilina boulardi]